MSEMLGGSGDIDRQEQVSLEVALFEHVDIRPGTVEGHAELGQDPRSVAPESYRGSAFSETGGLLEDGHVMAIGRQCPGHGEASDPRPDDQHPGRRSYHYADSTIIAVPPPKNAERREALADAAIEVLGTRGIHLLSHRAVDETAGEPPGTASNYFRSRDEMLDAVARRIVDLHLAEMNASADSIQEQDGAVDLSQIAAMIGFSLYSAATSHSTRFIAIYELTLEQTRRPALRESLSCIARTTLDATVAHHRMLGLDSTPAQVKELMTLFGGALFALVTGPPEEVTPEATRILARAMVEGVLRGR
jgi:DNA-binding transcriptional regulator YbjK